MIPKAKALEILARHGWEPWSLTAWWPDTGLRDVTSSFYATFGNQDHYNKTELYLWLGY